jgi:eukaryotic translation initiation factor 2C
MGVSYASPAYYADRLCERGRCYLRRWYNPERALHDTYDTRKDAEEKPVELARARPQRQRGQRKTAQGIEEDKMDKAEVLTRMKD